MLVYADITDLAVLAGYLLTSLQKLDKALFRISKSLCCSHPQGALQEPKMKDCALFNNTTPANFFWVKCIRFSPCHDRDFRKRPGDFRRFLTTFLRLPNIAENVSRCSEDIWALPKLLYVLTKSKHNFAAGLAQSVERVHCKAGGRRFDSRGWTNTQGLKITEKRRYSLCTATG